MADNEKDVPIREQEDGSILAKVEFPEEIGDDEVKKGKKADKDDDHDDEDHEEHEEMSLFVAAARRRQCTTSCPS